MFTLNKSAFLLFSALLLLIAIFIAYPREQSTVPLIAIANWGPHSSLQQTVQGIQDELSALGLHENVDIRYEIQDVNFEPRLIPQMLAKLNASRPKVLVAVATPVAQMAKNQIHDIPIVFASITDPVAAGLLSDPYQATGNITGSSDKQDLSKLLSFAKELIPHAHRVGILYATNESNDAALVKMMRDAAQTQTMEVVAIPVNEAREVPLRMQLFKDKVDFIYVGASGPIQPSLPAIVAAADKMKIPVFNMNAEEVQAHKVLASFGVSYYEVGRNAGKIVFDLFKGKPVETITPLYPSTQAYTAKISKKRAEAIGFKIPPQFKEIVVEE